MYLSGCHLISTPDALSTESEDRLISVDEAIDGVMPEPCTRVASQKGGAFSSWWEGEWEMSATRLAAQLADRLGGQAIDPDLRAISASLTEAFYLKVGTQQATLKVDGEALRFATTPLGGQRGLRLVGAQQEVMLWCEGEQVFWRSAEGKRFPLTIKK